MMSENKKKVQWRLEWDTAHFLFVLCHDIVDCIVTQCAQQARIGRQDTATTRPSMPTILPEDDLRHDRPAHGACGSACAHGLARGKSRYNGLHRGLGWPLCRNRGCYTGCDIAPSALRHSTWQGLGSRYNFCIVTERDDDTAACARVIAATRQGMAYDTALYAP